jgi:hypothetical protein
VLRIFYLRIHSISRPEAIRQCSQPPQKPHSGSYNLGWHPRSPIQDDHEGLHLNATEWLSLLSTCYVHLNTF